MSFSCLDIGVHFILFFQVLEPDLGELFNIPWENITWPLYVIVPGLVILGFGLFAGQGSQGVAIFGSIVTVTGGILFYQENANAFESWAYVWTLIFPGAIGLALLLFGLVHRIPEVTGRGVRMLGVAFFMLVVFWSLVEGIPGFGSFGESPLAKFAGPLLLIGLGVYLLWRRSLGGRGLRSEG